MISASRHPAVKPPRLLVVDDMPDNLFLMNGLFEDRFRVVLAPSGAEALKVVMSDEPPDMVLLDIMMPDMDGYEVLRRIRQHAPTAAIPVIFLTALGSPQDERLGMDLGAIDYLTKPVDPAEVIRRVEDHVRRTTQRLRMDELAEKLARQLPPAAWEALFHGADGDTIRFEEKEVTLLHAETTLLPAWGERRRDSYEGEVAWLAERYDARLDSFVWGATLAVFASAQQAVRMAMDLQRSEVNLQLRIGVHSGVALLARFRSEGEERWTVLGPELAAAARVSASAASGSIVISPETYAQVHEHLHVDAAGCVLTEEFLDSDLAQASITPAPARGVSELSTFAGLGFN